MAIKQISVFLENRPGTLQAMTDVLAGASIDLRALSVAETKDFGIVRMIVNDIYDTATVLKDAGYICSMTPVVAVPIPDEVGGLSRVLRAINDAGVNVEYMYASLAGKTSGTAYMIFRVSDTASAERALSLAGLHPLTQSEMDAI